MGEYERLDRRLETVLKGAELGLWDLNDRYTRTKFRMEFGSADWRERLWFYSQWLRRQFTEDWA